jgi:hypothetical protein
LKQCLCPADRKQFCLGYGFEPPRRFEKYFLCTFHGTHNFLRLFYFEISTFRLNEFMYSYEIYFLPSNQFLNYLYLKVSSAVLENQIREYEAIYSQIKDATGVSSIDEAVTRFESQGETSKHLQNLKV